MSAQRKPEEDSLSKERVSKMSPRDVTNLSPQELALRGIATGRNYARPLLSAILNSDLSDGGFRLLCLLGAATWNEGEVSLSFPELAQAMHVNLRTIQRQVAELEALKLIRVYKRHNHRNRYVVIGGVEIREHRTAKPPLAEPVEDCVNCTRGLPVTKRGLCVACCREESKREAWMEAKEQLGHGAAKVDIAARVLANRAVKSHTQAARDAERLERYQDEWTA